MTHVLFPAHELDSSQVLDTPDLADFNFWGCKQASTIIFSCPLIDTRGGKIILNLKPN